MIIQFDLFLLEFYLEKSGNDRDRIDDVCG
jgi:hypothetical protein